MVTKTELTWLLSKFVKIKIRFDKAEQAYTVNDLHIDKINSIYFDELTSEIESKLPHVLKISTDRREFLSEVLEILLAKINWYRKNNMYDDSFIKEFATGIKEINTGRKAARNFGLMLITKPIINKEIPDENQLSLLSAVLEMHYEALDELFNSISKLEIEIDTINIDELITVNFRKNFEKTSAKCNVNLDKISTANLFYLLMSAGFFSMDENDSVNDRQLMFEFIENNFTYGTKGKDKHLITKISKEFTYIHSDRNLTQRNIIAKLIQQLQAEISILDRYKKSPKNP